MSYDSEIKSFDREVQYAINVCLDHCANYYGVSPCTASGSPYCYYTRYTCQDPANFIKTDKVFRFCLNEGTPIEDHFPLVETITDVPSEIDEKNFVTRRARVTIQMIDDFPLPLANADKILPIINQPSFGNKTLVYSNSPSLVDRPALLQLTNGDILCFFDESANVYCVKSIDGGVSWGSRVTVYAGASFDITVSVIQLNNGDILCAFATDEDDSIFKYDIKTVKSTDGGSSWGSKTIVYAAAGKINIWPSIIKTSDGDLLCAFSTDEDGSVTNIKMVRSLDGGSSWSNKVTIYPGTASFAANTPYLFELPSKKILCAFSTSEDTYPYYAIKQVESSDHGWTWSNTIVLLTSPSASYQRPIITYNHQLSSLLCFFGTSEAGNFDIKVIESSDFGSSWGSTKTIVYASATTDTNPGAILKTDDKILCAFATVEDTYWAIKTVERDSFTITGYTNYSNTETDGTFFRNLIARFPYFKGRLVEIKQGFEGLDLSEFRTIFYGIIDNIEIDKNGKVKIVAKDQFSALQQKVPNISSTDNKLTQTYNGGTNMYVTNADKFQDPSDYPDGLAVVQIEQELITYTGKDLAGNRLTGCIGGQYGTSSVSHNIGETIKQAVSFTTLAAGDNIVPTIIYMDLLCWWGQIDPTLLYYPDISTTLTSLISDSATTIPVSSVAYLSDSGGIVKIEGAGANEDELIEYGGLSGSSLINCKRGRYGTTPAYHETGAGVRPPSIGLELDRWMTGTAYARTLTSPQTVSQLLNEFRGQTLVSLWHGEDSLIRGKVMAPPWFENPPYELDDESGLIDDSVDIDYNEESRISRVFVHFKPNSDNPGKDPDKFDDLYVAVDNETEDKNFYGEVVPRTIFATFINREIEARVLGARLLARFRLGTKKVKGSVELKDYELTTGDFIYITTRDILNVNGTPKKVLYEILKKGYKKKNEYELLFLDTSIVRRYPVISPTTITYDYDSASENEQSRYGWVGDSDNLVGTAPNKVDGYYII